MSRNIVTLVTIVRAHSQTFGQKVALLASFRAMWCKVLRIFHLFKRIEEGRPMQPVDSFIDIHRGRGQRFLLYLAEGDRQFVEWPTSAQALGQEMFDQKRC